MLTQLGDITTAQFLNEYWQQQPLCIRQAIPLDSSPVSPEELAGFALEADIESRLIIETPQHQWRLQHGPFNETVFNNLPKKRWTLLVQGVDALNTEVDNLLKLFRFLPSWRLDDIMVSYAADQGSVGPHFDHYDVFLIQTQGDRLWKIGDLCDANTPLADNCDLSILKDFNTTQEWLLKPGDMLYLPPRIAHWGVAQGPCMTFSVGFRAPKSHEMLSSLCDFLLDNMPTDDYYRDPPLTPTQRPGCIPEETLHNVQQLLLSKLSDKKQFAQWFGEYVSTPRYQDLEFLGSDTDATASHYQPVPGSRYLYCEINGTESQLFINGESWLTDTTFARMLCDDAVISGEQLSDENLALLDELIELGVVQPLIEG